MSPRKEAEAPAPAALKFVGRADYFVSGVPQSDLKVVDAPSAPGHVDVSAALELMATGLYVEMSAEEYAAKYEAAQSAEGE